MDLLAVTADSAEEEHSEHDADEQASDDEDDDDDIQIRIGEVRPNVPFAALQKGVSGIGTAGGGGGTTGAGKLDIEAVATIGDQVIYDADIAGMDEKPWRKPGADITDYFNYGFTEDTWNKYCERQRKLRGEYAGDQSAANKKLFSDIKLTTSNTQQMVAHQRQLNHIAQQQGTVKVTRIDLSGQADQYEVSASDLAAGVTRLATVNLMQNEQAASGGGITVLGGQAQLNIHQMQHDLQEQAGETPSQPPVNQPPVTMANILPPVHIRPTTVANAAINPPGMPNMNLPPPGYAASGYALAPPPSFGQRMPLPLPQVGRAGFIGYTPHQPTHFKEEDEASYSDTSDIDEPPGAGPISHQNMPNAPFPGYRGESGRGRGSGGGGGYGGGRGAYQQGPPPAAPQERGRTYRPPPAIDDGTKPAVRPRRSTSRGHGGSSSRRDDDRSRDDRPRDDRPRDDRRRDERRSSRERDDRKRKRSDKRDDDDRDDKRSRGRKGGDRVKTEADDTH